MEKRSFKSRVDGFFKISERQSSFRIEIVAGLVTFLAMAYILTVNPNSISSLDLRPNEWASVFIATAIGAIVGTSLMAFLARMPLAQAPGLGLNSMVGGLIGGWGAFQCSLGNAMLLVFISGVLFLLLSILTIKGVSIRELIFNGIPSCVRTSISIGIGLFIAFIGLQNAGVIGDNQFTLVGLVDFTSYDLAKVAGPIVCLVGVITIAVLDHLKVRGAVIIGIIFASLIGIPLGITTWNPGNYTWKFWEHFANYFSFNGAKNGGVFLSAFYEGFSFPEGTSIISCIMMILTFCMIDMFDTMGTVVGCCGSVGLVDENDKPLNYNKIMISDSVATCVGAASGTSTVTTFIESGAGIAAGGKTGLTALTTACCFFLAIFLMPLISSIPSAAAASALVYVGCLMLRGVKKIKLDSIKEVVPAFLTITLMPLAYSITTGIGFGILSYVVIDLIIYTVMKIRYAITKKGENPKWDLSVVLLIVGALFIIYFFIPVSF